MITIKLLNGDELTYKLYHRNGRGKWTTNHPRLEKMVYEHLGITWNEYHIKFIFGDEEERLTDIVRRQEAKSKEWNEQHNSGYGIRILTEEEIAARVAEMMGASHGFNELVTLYRERLITGDTTVYVFAEKREKTMEEIFASLEDSESDFEQE